MSLTAAELRLFVYRNARAHVSPCQPTRSDPLQLWHISDNTDSCWHRSVAADHVYIHCRNREDIEDVRREVRILHHLGGHPNITQLRGAYEDRHNVHLVGGPEMLRGPAAATMHHRTWLFVAAWLM